MNEEITKELYFSKAIHRDFPEFVPCGSENPFVVVFEQLT